MNRGHCHCGHNTVDKVYPIGGYVKIGYSPEGRARRFKFDIAKYCAMWPEARPCMLIQRPGDASSYIANTDMDGGYIVWLVSRYDTEKVGTGKMWVAFYGENGRQIGLTPETRISVESGPPNINDYMPHESMIPWVQRVLWAADRAEAAAESVQNMVMENTIPNGGTAGQALVKISDADKDIGWADVGADCNCDNSPEIVTAATKDDFPSTGDVNVLYRASEEKRLYQWNDEEKKYDPIAGGGGLIVEEDSVIHGGGALISGAESIEDTIIHGGDANGNS